MKSHLKVKVFSLSSEMTYIRRQEEKWKRKAKLARARIKQGLPTKTSVEYCEANFWSQRSHRSDLKIDARTAHLAYGAMKGIPYSRMEVVCYAPIKGYNRYAPNWNAIQSTIERFSKDEPNSQEFMQKFSEWLDDAQKWYDGNEARIEYLRVSRKAARIERDLDPAWLAAKQAAAQKAREANQKAA